GTRPGRPPGPLSRSDPARSRRCAILGGMDPVLVIGFAGLVRALVGALIVLRRRAEQVELLRERLLAATDQGAGRQAALAGDEADDLLPVGVLRFDAAGQVIAAN